MSAKYKDSDSNQSTTFNYSEDRRSSIDSEYSSGSTQKIETSSYITWDGSDLVKIAGTSSDMSASISYSSLPDKNGLSSSLVLFVGSQFVSPDSFITLPLFSTLIGINSTHLPQRIIYSDKYNYGYDIFMNYTLDDTGYVKSIVQDNGEVVKFFYLDEPVSQEEGEF